MIVSSCKSNNIIEPETQKTLEVQETIPYPEIIHPEENTFCGTWASSQYSSEGNMPPVTLAGNSLRQIVKTSVEGEYLRFHFSNYLGAEKLVLKSVHVAKSAGQGSAAIIPETDTIITFNGKTGTEISPYSDAISDTIKFSAPALSELAITIYFGVIPSTLTGHIGSRTNSFIEFGNQVSLEKFSKSFKTTHWYVLSGIDVSTTDECNSIVCFGDSITDGRGTTDDKQNRWTDILSNRLQQNPKTKNLGVINQGIGGTCITSSGVERFQRDVLAQRKVKYLVILYGVNDIIYANISSEILINTYKKMISKAHEQNMIVYGGTILPFKNANGWNSQKEQIRKEVNNWIKTASVEEGGFDGFIDFATPMTDPVNEDALNKELNFENDGLHPNAKGYDVMGNSIDLSLFYND